MNDTMLKLTKETVDDNATIFVISLVTLIYLPSQWVATFLGMNFFEYDIASGNFKSSKSVWLYFAIAAPLTTLTILAWRVQASRQKKHRKLEREKLESEYD